MPFRVLDTRLEGPLLLEPAAFADDRGFFMESYRRSEYAEVGIPEEFVQDNHSRSARGVVRGMHFQLGRGVSKLVRCARGEIVDVLVDIRRGSPAFGEWEAFTLNDENRHVLYAPIGFAHGFCVMSEIADVVYKQDAYYSELESEFAWNDPDVGIEWPLPLDELQVSDRDAQAPRLAEIAADLPFEYAARPAG
jgi:dTDP-4-dehydrorhamnose 3,5-epimerase